MQAHPSNPCRLARKFAALMVSSLVASAAMAQVTFYENDNYGGRNFSTQRSVVSFMNHGFNDRASSVVVTSQLWEVCANARFSGPCVVLRPGNYPSLRAMGLNDQVSSVRMLQASARIADDRYAPAPPPGPLGGPSPRNGRWYQANVIAVRAIMGAADQRCWVEPEAVMQAHGTQQFPGRRLGQGAGTTSDGSADRATDRLTDRARHRDAQRCASVPRLRGSDYWEVTYTFRGREHMLEMIEPPSSTIVVNRQGEPRG